MRKIVLTQGQAALVDDKDFEWLNQWKWYARKTRHLFYAQRNSPTINGKRYLILMHHVIIGKPPEGFVTDHENGTGTDNQRKNLRHVTQRQNMQNIQKKFKTSRYPGVIFHKQNKNWVAHITINSKMKHLGSFTIEKEAFKAYRQAVEIIGEEVIEGVI